MIKSTLLLIIVVNIICSDVPLTCFDAHKEEQCLDIINGIYDCIWKNDICVMKSCEKIFDHDCDGESYNGINCSTSGKGCKGVKQCSDIDNQKSCNIVQPLGTQCYWNEQCRNKTCKDNTKELCQITNGQYCIYQNQECQSIQNCQEIQQEEQCIIAKINSITCLWEQNQCIQGNCQQIQNEEECFKTVRNNENCFYSQDNNNGNVCLSCSSINEQCTCDHYNLFGCTWQKGQCKQTNCSSFTTNQECSNAYDTLTCTWYSPMNKCMTIYQASEFDRKCDIYSWGNILTIIILIFLQ